MQELVLTLDIGSSSVRCRAYDQAARHVSSTPDNPPLHARTYALGNDGTLPVGEVTATADAVVDDCLADLRRLSGDVRILGVGISSLAMSLVGVDAAGWPVTPGFTYACRHGAAAAEQLRGQLEKQGELEATWARTGVPIHTAYAPAQLLGLAATEPGLLAQTACWQTLGSHLLARWTGRPAAPISTCEAGWTGLQDRHRQAWSCELLNLLPISEEHLPPLRDYSEGLATLAPAYAQRWPELAESRFCLPVGDGAAANIGSGAVDRTSLAVTIGTSAAVRVVLPNRPDGTAPEVPVGLWCYRIDHNRHLLGGALTDGGSIPVWICNLLGETRADLEQQARAVHPDSHGLTILPFLQGERSPGWADNASLSLHGITAGTEPGQLMRAGLEAVTYRLALIIRKLTPAIQPDTAILASGGNLEYSDLWCRILAGTSQRPVQRTRSTETTSRGAAILTLEAILESEARSPEFHIADRFEPNPDEAPIYDHGLARQVELYEHIYGQA